MGQNCWLWGCSDYTGDWMEIGQTMTNLYIYSQPSEMVWNCWRIWNDLDPAGAKHVVWKAQLPSLVSFPKPSGRLSWLWRLIMLSVLLPFKRFGRDLGDWAANAQNKNVSSGGLKYVEVVSCCVFGMTNSKNKGSTNRTKRTKKRSNTQETGICNLSLRHLSLRHSSRAAIHNSALQPPRSAESVVCTSGRKCSRGEGTKCQQWHCQTPPPRRVSHVVI